MTALALTDRDTVAGTVRFVTAAAAAGIRPVFASTSPSLSPLSARPPRPPDGRAYRCAEARP
jgi:error-prone DNA polymerase